MARFFSRFRSRDKPVNRTAGSSFTFYMGGSSSGKYVNERSAMQMTAVYACVRILSEAVAGLPLHLYQYNDSGGKEKAVDHPLYRFGCSERYRKLSHGVRDEPPAHLNPLCINEKQKIAVTVTLYQNNRDSVAKFGYLDTMQPFSVKLCAIW